MRSLFLCFLVVCCACVPINSATASLPIGLHEQDCQIIGELQTVYSFPLKVDMPLPQDIPSNVRQYKMSPIRMTEDSMKNLLSGKTQPTRPAEKWVFEINNDTESLRFLYQEGSLHYQWIFSSLDSFPYDQANNDEGMQKAIRSMREIMNNLGVSYEYPFYTASPAALTLNSRLSDIHIESSKQVEDILRVSTNENQKDKYGFMKSNLAFDDDYIYIRARLQVNGIPLAISGIKSPSYQSDNPVFDEGTGVLAQFNSAGEITFLEGSNMHIVEKEVPDPQPLLPWEECIQALCSDSTIFMDMKQIMLVRTELCYAINGEGITYPVWQFIIELQSINENALLPEEIIAFPFYVDAHTGARL